MLMVLLMEEILHQLIGSLSHYLQGFIHPRWFAGFLPSTVFTRKDGGIFHPAIILVYWAVLSDEQMSNGCPLFLLNDEQMSNKVGVEHQPVYRECKFFRLTQNRRLSAHRALQHALLWSWTERWMIYQGFFLYQKLGCCNCVICYLGFQKTNLGQVVFVQWMIQFESI